MLYKLSLHSHLSDIDHLVFTKARHEIYLEKMLRNLLKRHGNLVLGVANFNDDGRYEAMVEGSKKLPRDFKIDFTFKDYFITIYHKNRVVHLVKTDEIETREGHILLIGHRGKVETRSISKLLKEAHKEKEIIIANHPLHKFGISYFLIKSLFGRPSRLSMSLEELQRYKKDYDAVELNAYFPQDWKSIRTFAKKNKIPLVSDSDSHFIDELFRSYYEVDNLSFEDPKKFKKTLKEALKKHIILHAKKQGYIAEYRHALMVLLVEMLGIKTGLIRREVFERK